MDATPRTGTRRIPPLSRTALLLAGAALLAGCGSTQVTGAGGGAPAPGRGTGGPTGATATGTATSTSAATATPTPTPEPTCSPEGVLLAAEEANAAMGLRVMAIRLTNCGTRPYKLNGRPDVRVLGAEREPLDVNVRRGSAGIATIDGFDAAPAPVTLQPQESAVFQLVWRNTVTSGTKDSGQYLDVAPLPGRPRVTVPAYLDLGTTGKLGVGVWTKPSTNRPTAPAYPQTQPQPQTQSRP
ncbi:DUF4232 domain-containing protein [Kitasatospora sp. NPDC092286]|uniref:DUF4232 domain-containing protein n=1 Tax=Kitasatospora sp. NPDC092286 TaxID=3364087 RepID=UPI00381C12CC